MNEIPSEWNLPPGVSEGDSNAPWNEPKCCGNCAHLLEGCCDYGICELEFEDAFRDELICRDSAWEAAQWALKWIPAHWRDAEDSDECCERFQW